jgi:hypothetical protein
MPEFAYLFLYVAYQSRSEVFFVNGSYRDTFLRRGVVSTSPNSQTGGQPLVGCPWRLNIFAATLHAGYRSSICNLRTRHAVVTGTGGGHL